MHLTERELLDQAKVQLVALLPSYIEVAEPSYDQPGVRLAVDALAAGGVPAQTVQATLVAYVNELNEAYNAA